LKGQPNNFKKEILECKIQRVNEALRVKFPRDY